MNLHCHFSDHAPAPSILENRGFAFSRCRRCRCFVIRSLGSAEAPWRLVPSGFRISWNGVDARMFDLPSWWSRLDARARLEVARSDAWLKKLDKAVAIHLVNAARPFHRATEKIIDFARAGNASLAVLTWMCSDALRLGASRVRANVLAAHKVIRLGGSSPEAMRWNVVINLHVHPSSEQLIVQGLGGSARVGNQVTAGLGRRPSVCRTPVANKATIE